MCVCLVVSGGEGEREVPVVNLHPSLSLPAAAAAAAFD